MPDIKIESGVPIPPKGGRPSTYPFPSMEVGDSFFVPLSSRVSRRTIMNRITNAGRYHGVKLNRRFAVRMLDDGVRCWRVE